MYNLITKNQMPFAGAKGYHNKTLAYSIWHIFRIEDIVSHEMIAGDEQILFREDMFELYESALSEPEGIELRKGH